MRVKWAPSVILGGPFFKKGCPINGSPERYSTWVGLDGHFAAILEHLGNWKNQNSNYCRIPEVWPQKFKESFWAAVKSVLLSVMFSNTFISKKQYLHVSLGLFFCTPFDAATYILCSNFFPNCGNPARPRSRINPVVQYIVTFTLYG